MPMIIYQALLSNPENVNRVRSAIREIERAGGSVQIAPPSKVGMTVVILRLPDTRRPDEFLPGLPFYPV